MDENNTGVAVPDSPEQTPETPSRPEWSPEKFWNPERGEVEVEKLATAYSHLEKKTSELLGGKGLEEYKNDVMETTKKSLEEERFKDRPEDPGKYEVKWNDGDLPEGVEWNEETDSELMSWWRQTAHNNGLGQNAFMDGIRAYAQVELAKIPNKDQVAEQLGETGNKRIEAVDLWAQKTLSPDLYQKAAENITTAGAIEVLEEIMGLTNTNVGDNALGGSESPIKTREELRALQNDPRYFDPSQRDPKYIAEVRREFERAYPGDRPSS